METGDRRVTAGLMRTESFDQKPFHNSVYAINFIPPPLPVNVSSKHPKSQGVAGNRKCERRPTTNNPRV